VIVTKFYAYPGNCRQAVPGGAWKFVFLGEAGHAIVPLRTLAKWAAASISAEPKLRALDVEKRYARARFFRDHV